MNFLYRLKFLHVAHTGTNWLISQHLQSLLFFTVLKIFNAMKEKDTKNSDNGSLPATTKATSPIVIKIEAPKEAIKKKIQQQINAEEKKVTTEDISKSTACKSRCCQFLPVLLFLVTFATVLTALIIYMDPSSKCNHR